MSHEERRDIIDISLPAPLDEPMEKLRLGMTGGDLKEAIDELIERQNALVEVVKQMALKGIR